MRSASSHENGPCFCTARELAEGYRDARITPVAVVESHLQRIAMRDGELHAFTAVFAEDARAAAIASTRRHQAGRALSALDGVPIAIKDLIDVAGKRCAAGSATRLDRIAQDDAVIVTRLIAAGAIILGKTHTVEFAFGGWGTNAHLGSPRNPWASDVPHTAGGSSSGSAVAVAARLATLAIGTDTGGSIRVPAGFNGLVGLKPTSGRISVAGIAPLSPSLDSVGPIARTVDDAALLFQLLLDDPAEASEALAGLDDGVRGMTLAVLSDAELAQVDDDITRCYRESIRVFESLGARTVIVELPRALGDYGRGAEIMSAEAYALYGVLAEDHATHMDPAVRARIVGGAIPARSVGLARERARDDARALLATLAACQALLTPTAATLPIPLARVDETTTPSLLTRFVNLLGLCALALPNGLSRTHLPSSLQIVCRAGDDALALRIGRALETAGFMHGALPPMAQ